MSPSPPSAYAREKRASIPEAAYTYVSDYLSGPEAALLFDWLLANADWGCERLEMFGRSVAAPRLVAWYGDAGVTYRYSNIAHRAGGWPAVLDPLLARLRAELAPGVNFLLVNRYRHGGDSMGWHIDAEPEVRDPIVSITLGATRRFQLRSVAGAPTVSLDPVHGSALIHGRHCPHALPKTRRRVAERISLSFRTIGAG
jgi:alkylated DNA repair dioxygenase AlkB